MTSTITASVTTNWDLLILHEVNPTGKEIGRGAFGRVFEVDYEGTLCAAKEVHTLLLQYSQGDDLQKIKDDFLSECQIWSTLRHPCVVQFLGVYYPAMNQYSLPVMVMEKMQHSLRGLVEKYDNILNVKLSILDEVCLGLRYLHSRNPPIVHRDLTPNNILLSFRLGAKITDLGVAKVVRSDNQKTMTKLPGTPDFMPPEALSMRPVYGPSLDMFSYGGVILNITTQVWPQPTDLIELNPDTGRREIVSEVKRRQLYLDKMTGGTADLKPLVMSCLDDNPKNHPPVTQVSMEIKRVKDACSQKSSRDGMSPIVWWGEVSNEQQSQLASSLTTALEEMTINNEQLKRQNDTMKDEVIQLKAEVDMTKVQNVELKKENDGLKKEVDDLKARFLGKSRSLHPPPVPQRRHNLKQQLVLMESTTPGDLFSGPMNIKWEGVAPAPIGRVDHTAVWLNGLVYVGGGYETKLVLKSYTINCYDLVNNFWSSPIRTPFCYFAMAILNNKLLIAGGESQNGTVTNRMFTWDDNQLKNYTRMITARSSATATGHHGMLIITGGMDANSVRLSSTELYDSDNDQCYMCDDLPQPSSSLRSVIVDNILYLLGGNTKDGPSSAMFTAPLDTLSRHQLKWNTYQDTPSFLSAPVSIYGTQLLIIGGSKKSRDKYIPTSSIYKLDKVNHSWEAVGNIPSARSHSAAVSISGNRIIVIGGRNNFASNSTITVLIGSCEPQ